MKIKQSTVIEGAEVTKLSSIKLIKGETIDIYSTEDEVYFTRDEEVLFKMDTRDFSLAPFDLQFHVRLGGQWVCTEELPPTPEPFLKL